MALQYYKVPKSYFEENFGIPIDGEREQPSLMTKPTDGFFS